MRITCRLIAKGQTLMSYTTDRDHCIARLTTEGLPYHVIVTLLRCATTIQRLAELACSSEAADRDRIKCPNSIPGNNKIPCLCDARVGEPHQTIPRIRLQDYQAEQRAIKAVPAGWKVITQGDPRGYTLRVVPPSMAWSVAPIAVDNAPTQYGVFRPRQLAPGKLIPNHPITVCETESAALDYIRWNQDAIGIPARDSRLRW
jgi:hypothetical protein